VGDLEQHFLTDPEALAWIVAELDPRPGERVVELGAGAGTIARVLARTVAPADLTLVELDPRLAAGLRSRFVGSRVLAEDWRLAWRRLPSPDVLVVSLPHALVQAALAAAAAEAPPRVAVVAVAVDDPPRLPSGLVRTATRPLPAGSFEPPQPFAAAAWVIRPADRAGDGRRPPAAR
jgi:16S rRNA A1518/A1519 N6-dimethyltransferase RsmA/KsgA/DIM1 with predicted DNA glycosylase/AP lyase activity